MAIYQYGKYIPQIDSSAWIFPSADIIGNVIIGKGVYVGAGAVIRGDYGKIIIEDGVAIEELVMIHASPGGTTHIKTNAIIGHKAMLHKCTIQKDAVIGMSAVITNDAIVGKGAVIAEGTVVKNRDIIPDNSIAVGVPAKVKGLVPPNVQEFWLGAGELYRQLAKDYPKKLKQI